MFLFKIFLFRRFVPSKPHTGRCNQFLLSRSFKHSLFLDQALDRLVLTSSRITAFTPSTYQPCCLQGVLPAFAVGYLFSRGASRLDAFSVYPFPTWLPGYASDMQPVHQRSVHPGPLVLRTAPLRYLTPAPDRDRTVSRRSEPSSRAALIGEQPNPWNLLQPQDATSRHRGAKPPRRCGLLGEISLLSPR